MLHILALVIAAILGTQVTATAAILFLIREMSEYVRRLHDEEDRKKAERDAAKGWGDW